MVDKEGSYLSRGLQRKEYQVVDPKRPHDRPHRIEPTICKFEERKEDRFGFPNILNPHPRPSPNLKEVSTGDKTKA